MVDAFEEEGADAFGVEGLKFEHVFPGCDDDGCVDGGAWAWFDDEAAVLGLELVCEGEDFFDGGVVDVVAVVDDDAAVFKVVDGDFVGYWL